ncbi:MAG: cysteine desulfurase [Tannerella sp.]|jgi:cysteine desulfurase/selenocysteine lyase|nr:cysteine desulfurase [Tannerella sp.]
MDLELTGMERLREIAGQIYREQAGTASGSVQDDDFHLDGLYQSFAALQNGNIPYSEELRRLHFDGSAVTQGIFSPELIRRDFPVLRQHVNGRPLIWFDNAATTQKPQAVIDEVARFYAADNSNIHRGAHTLASRSTEAYEKARGKVQRFIGASEPEEIVFVRGTTEGINLIVQTFGRKYIQEGDEIIISTLDHHANIVPWQQLAREKNARLLAIPVDDSGDILLDAYERLLGPRTRVVSFGQVNNTFGTVAPAKTMIEMARRYNARTVIDGAQSIAHTPVDVQSLDCDFFVFSGHKIYAPNGIGAVYGRRELLEILPPWQGGGNMIRNVTLEETQFNGPPARYEAGTPNVAGAVGLGVALDYVQRIGLINIGKYEHELTEYARSRLAEIKGLRLIGNPRERISVVSFILEGLHTPEAGQLLDREGIALRAGHHCAQPALRRMGVEATVRPSFSFYNTFGEIDRLTEAVLKILAARR